MNDNSRLLTAKAAAKFLGVTTATLCKWRHLRKGPAYHKVTWEATYAREDLENYVRSTRVIPSEQPRIRQARRTRRGSR
jgi:hypothetical protein